MSASSAAFGQITSPMPVLEPEMTTAPTSSTYRASARRHHQ
jgi:hypothetical protein